jgi:flagellar basal-body rod modification protein FlgD
MSDNIVGTKNIWPNYAKNNVIAAANKPKDNTLGKDDFLKILIAQLQNQDPTQPLQDKEFIAQMAQFSSVEQLKSMADEMKMLRQSLGLAPGLIGKNVSWDTKDALGRNVTKSGVVDALTFKEGKQYAKVEGDEISLDKLTKVW